MPAVSAKQERFMQAVAHSPKFAKKVGVPQSVGKEFTMKKMAKGGGVAPTKMGAVKTAKPKMGSASSRADGIAQRGKTVGKMLRKGGMCK